MPAEHPEDLVVVAVAATAAEAAELHAALAAVGIEATIIEEDDAQAPVRADDSWQAEGIRLTVQSADAPPARQVLALREPRDEPATGDGDLTADEYARSARGAATFACLFPPLMILVLHIIVRARRAAAANPPADPAGFRRRLRYAVILGVLIPLAWVLGLVLLYAPIEWPL